MNKAKKNPIFVIMLTSVLLMSRAAHTCAQEVDDGIDVSQYRYEWLYSSCFGGPQYGVWLEYEPGTPHSYNSDYTNGHERSSVPWKAECGKAETRVIDLGLEWYYYDPTGIYKKPADSQVKGISGYVHINWGEENHPYNQGSSIPPEARELPYPYGVALVNENGEILQITDDQSQYDEIVQLAEQVISPTGIDIPGASTGTGNVFNDGWNDMISYVDQLWEFLGWLTGSDLGENPFPEFLEAVGVGQM